MKSAVENLNPTRVKMTVEVPYEEFAPSLDAAYKTISEQVTIPGFRKGKVPPRIIDQRVGRGAVIEEAVNNVLPGFYSMAVQEADLRPLSQPQIEVTKVPEADGEELTFTAELDVRPTIDLPDLGSIAVTVDDATVTDEDVQVLLNNLRERFGTTVPVERPAQDGDFVAVDLTASVAGEEIDSVKNHGYVLGSGTLLPGTDEALTGLSEGETTTFEAPLAGGDRAGETALITLTLQGVKERQLAEADDDFAQLASEFDTLEELNSSLREQASQGKLFEQGLQARERLLEQLLDTVDFPLPEGLVEAEVNSHLEGEGRLEDDEHRAEVTDQAERGIRAQILLDTLAEAQDVQITQQELVEYLVQTSQQYNMDPNTFIQAVSENGQISAMAAEVARRKALAMVLEQATVTDSSGNEVDLSALFSAPESDLEEASALDDAEGAEGLGGDSPISVDPAAVSVSDLGGFVPDDEEPADKA